MLGKFLDPLADKLIVTAVLVYMVALGRVPAWVVVVLIARDLAVNGLRSIASRAGAGDRRQRRRQDQDGVAAGRDHDAAHPLPLPGAGRRHPPSTTTSPGRWLLYVSTGRVAVFGRAVHAALPVGGAASSPRATDVIAVAAAPLAAGRGRAAGRGAAGGVLAVGAGGRRGRRRARYGRRRAPVGSCAATRRRISRARAGVGGGARGMGRAGRRRRRPASRRRWAGSRTISGARSAACRRARGAGSAGRCSRFTSTTRSGCARPAATRRSSREDAAAARRLARARSSGRRRDAAPIRAGRARRPSTRTSVFLRRRRAHARLPARGRRLSGEPVAPAVGVVRAGASAPVALAAALRARRPRRTRR